MGGVCLSRLARSAVLGFFFMMAISERVLAHGGHEAASPPSVADGAFSTFGVVLTGLHVLAAAIWVGGLAFWVLGVLCSPESRLNSFVTDLAHRFTRMLAMAIPTLALTGIGKLILFSPVAPTRASSTGVPPSYVAALAIKSVLVCLMLVVGTTSHRMIQRERQSLTTVWRVLAVELLLGVIVFGVSTVMVFIHAGMHEFH